MRWLFEFGVLGLYEKAPTLPHWPMLLKDPDLLRVARTLAQFEPCWASSRHVGRRPSGSVIWTGLRLESRGRVDRKFFALFVRRLFEDQ